MAIFQKSINKKLTHARRVLGIHPIIQFFLEKLGVDRIMSNHIAQDARLQLSVAKTLGVLIHNILVASTPMYEISDWSKRICDSSLGLDESEVELIDDDRVGRALDIFYEGKHKSFFFQLALRAIKIFDLDCSQIHNDTTTITLSGKYRDWNAYEEAKRGMNKDHRPDLKQLVLGLSVTSDGAVPLTHKVYSGNQSDDTSHVENHQQLRKLLQQSDFIYVADSKLATTSNLFNIANYGGSFVTIMPRTWKEADDFKKKAMNNEIKWKHLMSKKSSETNHENKYDIATGNFSAGGYRLIWIRSDQKTVIDKQSRTESVENVLAELKSLELKLNKRKLRTKIEINKKITSILKGYQCLDIIKYEIQSHRHYDKGYGKKGRPSPDEKGTLTWEQSFSLIFFVDQISFDAAAMMDGVFPIVTNLAEDKKSAKDILEIYKYQPFLEKRHSQMKTWQQITPVLLKKGSRVVAYIHMHFLALMVASLIERTIRKTIKKQKIEPLELYPEERVCDAPTFYDLERLFRDVEKYEVKNKDEVIYFPAELNQLQKKVLNLLGVPLSLYQ